MDIKEFAHSLSCWELDEKVNTAVLLSVQYEAGTIVSLASGLETGTQPGSAKKQTNKQRNPDPSGQAFFVCLL